MRRALLLLTSCHVLLGSVCLLTGIIWIILHYLHPYFKDDRLPSFTFLVMLPEIVCGTLILACGIVGLFAKSSRRVMNVLFIVGNVVNALICTPVLAVGYALLVMTIYGDAFCGQQRCIPAGWDTYNIQYLLPNRQSWGYIFPGIGLSVAFLDFVFSVAVLTLYVCRPKKEPDV